MEHATQPVHARVPAPIALRRVPPAPVPDSSAAPLASRSRAVAKRCFDLAVAVPLLIAVSPLIALAAVWIKLDSPGPVLFRQERVGTGRRRFRLLKLRSMTVDAELRRAEVAALSLHGNGIHNGIFKARNDPRVTRVGAFLRRWSIDELPQLWNVVRGEMSMVGPRPLPFLEDGRIGPEHAARYAVRPGITGRWQVNGRSEIPVDGMLELDCAYVDEWTLGEDVKLILRTALVVARGRGAY
jgi:lipopolysaccharide/colanic/teichoic acid biosynthesis glycosyltransferase